MFGCVEAEYAHTSEAGGGQTEQNVNRGGFSRTIRPEQPDNLSGRDVKREPVERNR